MCILLLLTVLCRRSGPCKRFRRDRQQGLSDLSLLVQYRGVRRADVQATYSSQGQRTQRPVRHDGLPRRPSTLRRRGGLYLARVGDRRTAVQVADDQVHRSRIRILRIFFHSENLTNFTNFFSVEKNSVKIRNFADHRCLTCFDVLECNVHL